MALPQSESVNNSAAATATDASDIRIMYQVEYTSSGHNAIVKKHYLDPQAFMISDCAAKKDLDLTTPYLLFLLSNFLL